VSGRASKPIAIVLIAVVVAAGAGYWLLIPKTPSESVSHTTQQASLLTSSKQTQRTSTSSTTVTSEATLWINVTATKPVSYYLSLLESNRTEPYVQVAKELPKLPDLENASAVAKIVYLALNATNPEVKEAFELMMKGGTPASSDFTYAVPNYNTELQVLYWLACQNELKRDDTLALSIAMVSGLWVTMGTDEVRQAVFLDASSLLNFFRETNEIQRARGYHCLEDYPLEAKVVLAWTGNMAPTGGYHSLTGYRDRRLPLAAYRWDTVSVDTLRKMRTIANDEGWSSPDTDTTVMKIEEYLFTSGNPHWDYTCTQEKERNILVDGETVDNCGIFNVDWQFEQYLKTDKFVGGCADEASVANGFMIAIGTASTITSVRWGTKGDTGHFHVAYYEPHKGIWKINAEQLGIDVSAGSGKTLVNVFYLFIPPVNQKLYILWGDGVEQNLWIWKSKAWCMLFPTTIDELSRMFSRGVDSSQIKRWLLYGEKPVAVTTAYTTWAQQGTWNVLSDGSLDLIDEEGKIAGDLGQPYVDLAKVSYSFSNGSLYFRFDLRGKIPNETLTTHVASIWYQVLFDADSDPGTGFLWSSDFTPDYILQLYVDFDGSSKTPQVHSYVLKYSGTGSDWSWTPVGTTERFGSDATLAGGIGQDSFVLTCEYQDISVSKGSAVQFFARSGILYDGKVYNDPVPDKGTVKVAL